MSSNVTFNGSTYSIPADGDSGWGTNLSSYLIAIASGALQKTGGTFALTSEVDFGATFGAKLAYLKSQATNPASAGIVRLGNSESIKWRNAANSGDLDLTVNASDALQFNGSSFAISGNIVNADINAAAAIAYSKLNLSSSIVNADISNSAAIAYSKLNLSTSIVNADINSSAAISYSKLDLATSIVNADISASAAIAYSKLNLSTSIVNADISASAAIARSKLASGSANHVIINDASGVLSSEAALAISRGGTNNGSLAVTAGGVVYTDGSKLVNVGAGTAYQVLQSNGSSAPTWVTQSYYTLEQFGGAGDASTDNTSAFNSFLAAVASSSHKELRLNSGTYKFNSAPNDIATTVFITGTGKSTTVLDRNFNPSAGSGNGLLNLRSGASGSTLSNFSVRSLTGQTNGSLISIVGVLGGAPDFVTLDGLNLTTNSTSTHKETLFVDGSARTGAPIGVRDLVLNNCTIFGANDNAARFKSVVGLSISTTGIFSAGGASGTCIFDGVSSVKTQYVNAAFDTCSDLSLTQCTDININTGSIQGGIINTSTVSNLFLTSGSISGTVQSNWLNSVVKTPVLASFLATNTAGTAFGNGPTDIPFATEIYDDGSVYSSPTFTVPTAGDDIFNIGGKITFTGIINSGQFAQLTAIIGGTVYYLDILNGDNANTRTYTLQGSVPLKLAATNTVKLQITTNTAGNMTLNTTAGACYFYATKMG